MRKIITSALAASILMACSESAEETPSVDTVSFEENEIKSGELAGTYVNAGDGAPVVIMVPGSGPTDRDGNSMTGLKSNALKFIAEDLAKAGTSSVRVDKHGMFGSEASGDAFAATVDSYAADYRNWAATMTEKTGQSCVFLLGHSEGGTMITAAAIDQTNICGVILVSAAGRRLSDVIREQLESNPANKPVLDDAMAALAALENGEKYDTTDMHPALLSLFNPRVQDYLISLFAIDPAELLGELDIPKLVIQGNNDIQVSVADAQRLADKSGAKLVILDGINHVLKPAPTDRMGNIAVYNTPDLPVDAAVSQAIIGFIKE